MAEKMDEPLLVEAAYLRMHADQMERSPVPASRRLAKELRQQAIDRETAHFKAKAIQRRALGAACPASASPYLRAGRIHGRER